MNVPRVEVIEGPALNQRLADPRFIAQWLTLQGHCPHATVFQGPTFVLTWYRAYTAEWQPLLALLQDAQGQLQALWCLAHDPASQRLVQAGAHQAEYQAWLALPEVELAFLSGAWRELKRRLRFASLRLKYLPTPAMARTLQAVPGLKDCLVLRPHARPLLYLRPQEIEASLAKKSNHSRLNRLKRMGKLVFRRLGSSSELASVFDALIDFYDLRQGAVHGSVPFREDPCKRAFHQALFAQASAATLCVTVSYLDERPIAAFWGLDSGPMLHLGMLLHSPFLAPHSPGKLHLLQLSQHLLAQGQKVLDLTPGGDPWKERFANAHDEVAEACLYRSAWQRLLTQAGAAGMAGAKHGAAKLGLTPTMLRAALAKVRRLRPSSVWRKLAMLIGSQREFRVYRCSRALAQGWQADARVRRNALADLLCFEPCEPWESRDAFLSTALQRLENSESAYTVQLDGHLVHRGWMVRQSESHMSEVKQTWQFPPASVALYDFYTQPGYRGQGLYKATLGHMLQDAFADPHTQYAYISVLADNGPSRHVIESMGFVYQGSSHWQCRWGVETKWTNPLPAAPEALHA